MKTAFICNPADHRIKKFPNLVGMIQKSVPGKREIFLVDRSLPNSLESHVERALDSGFDRIAVAGGDGTLNRVINALMVRSASEKVILGLIPFGTCNDFARTLGVNARKTSKALDVLTKNSIRTFDVGRVNKHFFINNAGFGKRNPSALRRSNFRVLREMTPSSLKIKWPGGESEGKFFMLLCANAPYFSGGLRFSRKSDPSDGLFEFYFVRKMLKLGLALRLFMGKARIPLQISERSKSILKMSRSMLSFESEQPVSIVVDGDPRTDLTNIREATFQIAGKCRILSPA